MLKFLKNKTAEEQPGGAGGQGGKEKAAGNCKELNYCMNKI